MRWLYGQQFVDHTDADLVRYWNEGDGAIDWLRHLEAELNRRGYDTRSTDPADGRPRVGGERLHLTVRDTPESRQARTYGDTTGEAMGR